MLLPLIIIFIVSVGSVLSLIGLRKQFRLIEIVTMFMSLCIFIIEFGGMITLNLNLIKEARQASVSWFFMLFHLVVAPCVLLWLLYIWFSPKPTLGLKLASSVAWLLGLYGVELVFDQQGYWQLLNWNFGYSAMKWLAVLLPTAAFTFWFRRLLRRREAAV